MQKIICSEWVPEEILAKYRGEFEITAPSREKHAFTYEELKSQVADYEGVFILDNDGDRALIDAAKKIKAIANFGVGYDNIDWKYATQIGLPVINTPKSVTEATAEHSAIVILAVMRGITRYDREIHAGIWKSPNFDDCNTMVEGSTIGLVGFGRIGRRVCRKLQGFGMNVAYYDKFRASKEVEEEYGLTFMEMDELLEKCDVISPHMPYIPEDYHMFNAETFKKMKKTAYFINCSRGKMTDEQALADAIKNGEIKGAALDVFENEPHVNPDLLTLPNVVLTPHVASLTMRARVGMAYEALDGITAILRGEIPVNVANKEIFNK